MKKSNNKSHWYLKKGNFEAYEENPFIEKAIETISHNKVVKKQYMKGDRGVEQSIVNQDGIITGKSMFVRMIEVDEEKFAKLYLNELGILWDMKKPALKLFSYIMTILVPNKDDFYLSNKKAMEYTGYVTKTALNNALSQLFELGVIAKTTEENWYFINPLFVFNGSRITFAKTYIKKKKEVNINQAELPFLD